MMIKQQVVITTCCFFHPIDFFYSTIKGKIKKKSQKEVKNMYVKDDYFFYFILSLFKENSGTNSGQIENVLRGRKTPTILYLTEKNKWFPAYNLFPKVERNDIDKCIEILHTNGWIKYIDKKFNLTINGRSVLRDYFKNHAYPSSIDKISSRKIRKNFFEKYQFLTQIFSEMKYNNKQYSPISKSPKLQIWVKHFLKKVSSKINHKSLIEDVWIEENIKIFSKLSESSSYLLSKLLTGHKVLGYTFNQLIRDNNWSRLEFYILLQNAIEELMKVIHLEEVVVLNEVLNSAQKDNYYGLSKSAFQTAVYIGQNYPIQTIASKRGLKSNTIKEHILEISFIQKDFDFRVYIPDTIYYQLNRLFEERELAYKEANQILDGLEFMHFRLVELERLRNNNEFKQVTF